MNKKGIFMTTLALVLITLFVVSFTFYNELDQRKSTAKRIETMNNFIFSIETDLERQLYTAGYRAIFILEDKITSSGGYISQVNNSLYEIIINGSYNGVNETIMGGARIEDIKSLAIERADAIGLNLTLNERALQISQADPWNIKIVLSAELNITDQNNLARWDKYKNITALIPITNFEDPVYLVGTQGVVTNPIRKTPFETFASDGNASNLTIHATNSYYSASTDAPSFINRLGGNFLPDPNGIESIVNLNVLSAQGISVQDKSVIDHIYFSVQNPSNCHVSGAPSWLKIDNAHLAQYNATCG